MTIKYQTDQSASESADGNQSQRCNADEKSLEVAIMAWEAQFGAGPPTEQQLVPEFLRATSELFDVRDGVPYPVPAGPCA